LEGGDVNLKKAEFKFDRWKKADFKFQKAEFKFDRWKKADLKFHLFYIWTV
jgi:hypothetical protein